MSTRRKPAPPLQQRWIWAPAPNAQLCDRSCHSAEYLRWLVGLTGLTYEQAESRVAYAYSETMRRYLTDPSHRRPPYAYVYAMQALALEGRQYGTADLPARRPPRFHDPAMAEHWEH